MSASPSLTDLQFFPMSVARRREYFAQQHVAVVSIPDRDGHGPLCAPVWYWYQTGTGSEELWWITPGDSRKGRLLKVGLPLTFTVMDGDLNGRYASVEGAVTALEEPTTEDHQIPLAQRYLGIEPGTGYGLRMGEDNAGSYLIRVRPRRWLTGELLPASGSASEASR